MIAFLVVVANDWYPVIRFSDERLNVAVGTAICFMPFVTAIFALFIPRRWLTRIFVIVPLVPLMLVSLFVLLLDISISDIDTFRTGLNPAFEPIARVPMGGYSVGIYLTNCGAVCSFGIEILQEKQIVPGLLLVRRLEGFEPAIWPVYQVIGKGIIRVDVPRYGVGSDAALARSRTYYLKPYLYFGRRSAPANQTDERAPRPVLALARASLIMPNRVCANTVQQALGDDHMIPGIDAQCATVMAQALKLEHEHDARMPGI